MSNVLTPRGFLQVGGIVLVLIAILGYVNVIGPTPEASIFGPGWYFDNAENVAHLVLGIVALLAAFFVGAGVQKPLVIIVGVVGILVGLYSLFGDTMLLGAGLQNPADTLLHLVVGAWALWAGLKGAAASPMASM
ncbi:MAG: hypothetical protein UY63_C0005G0029 [Parcubacteria group bacterium GW2011_GWA2_51_10]|nr:MAG: hypothetical protein UY63_C0005G0029 [Parcubacteria group bacterium GW2011_GWA2_51_10]